MMKMNSLVDAELIDALYEAAEAGTRIDLIVREHLLPAAGRPRAVRDDPRTLARRPVPRALPHLPVRHRAGRPRTCSARPT